MESTLNSHYTYRELSELLNINLAKVKRWGREFLPPDLEAGRQQGISRVLPIDDAFMIYMGGFIVNDLKLSINDAKLIINDIHGWLVDHDLMPSLFEVSKQEKVKAWHIFIIPTRPFTKYYYLIKGSLEINREKGDGEKIISERYVQEEIYQKNTFRNCAFETSNVRILSITLILHLFATRLDRSLLEHINLQDSLYWWE